MRKKLGIFMLSAGMVFSLASCGGSSDIVEGSWALTKAYYGDTEISQETLQSQGVGGTTFTFQDGVVTISGSGEVSQGSYTLDGTTVTITSEEDGVSYTGTINDKVLTVVSNPDEDYSAEATEEPEESEKTEAEEDGEVQESADPEQSTDSADSAENTATPEMKLVFEKQ